MIIITEEEFRDIFIFMFQVERSQFTKYIRPSVWKEWKETFEETSSTKNFDIVRLHRRFYRRRFHSASSLHWREQGLIQSSLPKNSILLRKFCVWNTNPYCTPFKWIKSEKHYSGRWMAQRIYVSFLFRKENAWISNKTK